MENIKRTMGTSLFPMLIDRADEALLYVTQDNGICNMLGVCMMVRLCMCATRCVGRCELVCVSGVDE